MCIHVFISGKRLNLLWQKLQGWMLQIDVLHYQIGLPHLGGFTNQFSPAIFWYPWCSQIPDLGWFLPPEQMCSDFPDCILTSPQDLNCQGSLKPPSFLMFPVIDIKRIQHFPAIPGPQGGPHLAHAAGKRSARTSRSSPCYGRRAAISATSCGSCRSWSSSCRSSSDSTWAGWGWVEEEIPMGFYPLVN